AQGGAYATGVLVLITSAAIAVTLSARRRRQRGLTIAFSIISLVFLYTTAANVVERPDGVKIASCFIAGIIVVSLVSRLYRAFDLRVTTIDADEVATTFLRECGRRKIRLIANEPDRRDAEEYSEKIVQIVADNDLSDDHDIIFVEVTVVDASDFETALHVRGEVLHHRYRVFAMESTSVPSALAALLLYIRDVTRRRPHIYFEWTEGNPIANFMRYLIFGQGEVAPVTREMLRRAEPGRNRRPHVHVG
ncbi:MAG TPA: amino acid transporter, partial [Actinoplanes sp.]|nr:amino acid transporter [Actinoplanes sp.]